jgi:hypothetical protein
MRGISFFSEFTNPSHEGLDGHEPLEDVRGGVRGVERDTSDLERPLE